MNPSPDDDRLPADPWLREALRHAPDGDVPVPAAVRRAILDQARRAAAPAKARRQRSWRDALRQLLTPTGMGWAGAATACVLLLVVTLVQREPADVEQAMARSSGVTAQLPAATADAALPPASRARTESAPGGVADARGEGVNLALATPPLTAKIAANAQGPAPAAPAAPAAPGTDALQAASRGAMDTARMSPGPSAAITAPAAAAPGSPEAAPTVALASSAGEPPSSAPQAAGTAPAAPAAATAVGAAVPVLKAAPAAPPVAAADAASDGLRYPPRSLAQARTAPPDTAGAGSQPQRSSALAEATAARPAAAGLMAARAVSEDRLGDVLQWTQGREGLRWSADGREGPWGPAQDAWLRALRAAASGRWGEAPALPGTAGSVLLQAPGQPPVRLTVGDAPWAVWVQAEGTAPFATRLDSRARARIEAMRQGW